MLYKDNIWVQSRMTLISIYRTHTVNFKRRKATKKIKNSNKSWNNFKKMNKISLNSLEKMMIRFNNLITP